ncbi:MAG TPA: hypothetical protein PLQ93_12910, partial [Bacteroidia bacterium]|nr:hypothetical protein [Bacteroidia bacterium]
SNYINHLVDKNKAKPILLTDCFAWFMGYLKNEDVAEHEKIERDQRIHRAHERTFEYFVTSLKNHEPPIDVTNLKFVDVDPIMIGYYHTYLTGSDNPKGSPYAAKSYNNLMLDLKSFFINTTKRHYPQHVHPMVNFNKKIIIPKKDTIKESEFLQTINMITPENGLLKKTGKKVRWRNLYREWLKDAFIMGFLTGGRNKEVIFGKWSDINYTDDGQPSYIEVKNWKATAANKHLLEDDEYITKPFIIIPEVRQCLEELGLKSKRGNDEYIIPQDPNLASRQVMKEFMSAAFPHFFTLGNGVRKEFKLLRKTYATYLKANYGAQAAELFGDLKETMDKHYVHQGKLAEDFGKILEARNKDSGRSPRSFRG